MTDHPSLAGRDQLLAALGEMRAELAAGAQDWENVTLDRFLEAFEALMESIENAYTNTDRPVPADPWRIVADVFRGTR